MPSLTVGPGTSVTKIMGLLAAGWYVTAVLTGATRVRIDAAASRVAFAAAALLAWACASQLFFVDTEGLDPRLASLALLLVGSLLLSQLVRTPDDLRRAVTAIAIAGMVTASAVLGEVFFTASAAARPIFHYGSTVRGSGLLYDPNLSGAGMTMALPAVLAMLLTTRRNWVRVLCALGFALVVVATFLTQSRAAVASSGCVLGLCVLGYGRRSRARAMLLSILILTTVGAVLWFTPSSYEMRVATISQALHPGTAEEPSMRTRFNIARAAWRSFSNSPLVGVGFGNIEAAVEDNGAGIRRVAHNTLLQIAAELGIIGVVLATVFVIAVVAVYRKAQLWARSTEAGPSGAGRSGGLYVTSLGLGLVGYALNALFLSILTFMPAWITLGLLLGCAQLPPWRHIGLRGKPVS